jgi:osmotically inducible protein OsmC
MPRVRRAAEVIWEGNLARGGGRITADTGAFANLPYSSATRLGAPEGKTSPEELLAAAHAGCYAMSLAGELSRAGTPPERIDVRAVVTLDEVRGQGHRIVGSEIHVRVRVEGVEPMDLERATTAADEGCPFSALIRASGSVSVKTELEGGASGD